ncbi:ribonuclease HII [Chloroflexota bacterium]
MKFDPELIPERPNFEFETALWSEDTCFVAGIDEAGRGALAGPVAAAAVMFHADESLYQTLRGVRDSKQMTPASRSKWAEQLKEIARDFGVGLSSPEEIDEIGIVPATQLAASRALDRFRRSPRHILIDYLTIPNCSISQTPLVKGDARSLSIAAASILAKVARDALMCEFDFLYPGYGFAAHKGYGTIAHRESIDSLGACPIHRKSFRIKGVKIEGMSTKINHCGGTDD